MLKCLPCSQAHIEQLKPRIRAGDRIELALATGRAPEDVLQESYEFSTNTYVWMDDDVVLCVFGVATMPTDPTVGIPWMIASDEAVSSGIRFMRKCRQSFELLSNDHASLFNVVYAENKVAIGWLRWAGFSFGKTIKLGPHKSEFISFFKGKEYV